MARTQFTFTFRNGEPGAVITFSADVYVSKTAQNPEGPALVLDQERTVAVWSDATELTATWVDGAGVAVEAEASLAFPIVIETGGTAGASPADVPVVSVVAGAGITVDLTDPVNPVVAETFPMPAPASGDAGKVVAVNRAEDGYELDVASSGGSSAVLRVDLPFTHATPGLVPQPQAITAVDQGTQTVTVAGDQTALFPAASTAQIAGSTGNDGNYTVTSATLNAGATDIVVVEPLPDATADGTIADVNTTGIVVPGWTPAVGDTVLAFLSVPVAFDGTTPIADFYLDPTTAQNFGAILTYAGAAVNLTIADTAIAGTHLAAVGNGSTLPAVSGGLAYLTVTSPATQVRLVVSTDGTWNGSDPSPMTVGSAVLTLIVFPAP